MAKLEILVAAMHQKDLSLVEKMNINCDAIIANQADYDDFLTKEVDDKKISMITTSLRGVGKNRNLALNLATADILLMADEDCVYEENALLKTK